MSKVTAIRIYCRRGKVMLCNSEELSALLKDNKDYVMLVPVIVDSNDIQIREADHEQLKNLLPNQILTSPFRLLYNNMKDNSASFFNSTPFNTTKLQESLKKLLFLNSF